MFSSYTPNDIEDQLNVPRPQGMVWICLGEYVYEFPATAFPSMWGLAN